MLGSVRDKVVVEWCKWRGGKYHLVWWFWWSGGLAEEEEKGGVVLFWWFDRVNTWELDWA